jgi:hypothetical protein
VVDDGAVTHLNSFASSYTLTNRPTRKGGNKMTLEMNEVDELKKKLDEVLSLLRGNILDKSDMGFIGSVNDLEKRVSTLEKWKDRIVWMVIGMGIPASVGIVEILKKLLTP